MTCCAAVRVSLLPDTLLRTNEIKYCDWSQSCVSSGSSLRDALEVFDSASHQATTDSQWIKELCALAASAYFPSTVKPSDESSTSRTPANRKVTRLVRE